MRYSICVILCILFAVANSAFGASMRCTTVFPLVAKMIPTNVCTDDVYSVKALLRNDADCNAWRPTEQDALILSLPTDAALDGPLLCNGARQVRIDVFGGDVPLARLAVALMQGFGDR